MNEEDLKHRTKQFALRVIKLVDALPKTTAGRAIGGQLVRAGCRSRRWRRRRRRCGSWGWKII